MSAPFQLGRGQWEPLPRTGPAAWYWVLRPWWPTPGLNLVTPDGRPDNVEGTLYMLAEPGVHPVKNRPTHTPPLPTGWAPARSAEHRRSHHGVC